MKSYLFQKFYHNIPFAVPITPSLSLYSFRIWKFPPSLFFIIKFLSIHYMFDKSFQREPLFSLCCASWTLYISSHICSLLTSNYLDFNFNLPVHCFSLSSFCSHSLCALCIPISNSTYERLNICFFKFLGKLLRQF